MRLINTHTLEMESFSGPPPEFAILSHTWGTDDEEVTLQDMVTKPRAPDTLSKPGYIKIQKTCEVAREQFHHQYCWVDTACIDKTSSAELSEAINSMFKWYGNANICFAYLSDVEMGGANSEHPPDTRAELAKSRWFTRGWTLQELIAPGDMYFFDRNWHEIGMRSDLAGAIKFTTGIPAELLRWRPKNQDHELPYDLHEMLATYPVAVRMSWAAERRTKREEDMAYCLLGLFDINMPMLYGEGTKAFLRLQEEIIKQCPDMSLFAWLDTKIPSNIEYSGFLAHSPRLFAHAGSMVAKPELLLSRSDFSLTNRGIRFHTFVVDHDPSGVSLLPLGHRYASRNEILGVYMQQIGSDVFARKFPDMLAFADRIFTSGLKKGILENGDFSGQTSFLAPRKLSDGQAMRIPDTFLRLDSPEDLSENDRFLRYVEPSRCWAPKSRKLYGGFGGLFLGYFHFTPDWAELYDYYVVVVSFNMSKRERWRIALVKGKYWPKIMGGLHEYYQNRDDEFSTTQNITLSRGTSTYKNLRGSVRTIEVSCRLKNQDRLSASLCIEVVKSKERW